jgi:hypothetical protein
MNADMIFFFINIFFATAPFSAVNVDFIFIFPVERIIHPVTTVTECHVFFIIILAVCQGECIHSLMSN